MTPLLLPLLMVGCDGTPIVDVSSSETATQSSQVVISSSSLVASSAPLVSSSSVVKSSSSVAVSSSSLAVSSSSVATSSSSVASSSVASIPSGSTLVYAVNAGGPSLTLGGVTYQADRFSNGGTVNSTTNPIANTTNDALYQTERWGKYSYEIPVTNSTYSVALHFNELFQTAEARRYFSVTVEGKLIFSDLDLFAAAGHDTAYQINVPNVAVDDGKLTIELSASLDNGTINAFAIYSNAGGKFVEPPVVVGRQFPKYFVGNITTSDAVRSDFKNYWTQITPENEGKWGVVESTRGTYNWAGIDRAYNYAKQNNILFKQHTFVWGSQCPSWVGGSKCEGTSLSGAEYAKSIEGYIKAFCARYPDTPIIDVVNEATPGHAPAGYAQKAYGNDWITQSFKLARQYCPNSILVLNDYNVLSWNTDDFIAVAKTAAASGYVDAIGFQAHGLEGFTNAQLKANIDKVYNALKLPMYITEYDVAKTNDQEQLNIYKAQFPLFYNDSRIKGITLWGYVVGKTWVTGSGLIQDNGTPRPAMTWLMDYVKANPK